MNNEPSQSININNPSRITTVEPIQSTRRMKFLTVHKNELDNISSLNLHVTAFCSCGSFFASIFLSIILCYLIDVNNLDLFQNATLKGGMILSFLATLFFFYLAYCNRKKRNSIIKNIEDESS